MVSISGTVPPRIALEMVCQDHSSGIEREKGCGNKVVARGRHRLSAIGRRLMIQKATNGAPGVRRISLERRFPKVVALSEVALT
jgi:hypothetical protein